MHCVTGHQVIITPVVSGTPPSFFIFIYIHNNFCIAQTTAAQLFRLSNLINKVTFCAQYYKIVF